MTLKSHWFHILLALATDAHHGAEIRRRIRAAAGDNVEIYPAMLYGSLEDLLELGYIMEAEGPEREPPGRRRYYALTGPGREALAAETEKPIGRPAVATEEIRALRDEIEDSRVVVVATESELLRKVICVHTGVVGCLVNRC